MEVIDPESENAINEITVENAKKISKDYEAGDMLRVDAQHQRDFLAVWLLRPLSRC